MIMATCELIIMEKTIMKRGRLFYSSTHVVMRICGSSRTRPDRCARGTAAYFRCLVPFLIINKNGVCCVLFGCDSRVSLTFIRWTVVSGVKKTSEINYCYDYVITLGYPNIPVIIIIVGRIRTVCFVRYVKREWFV